MNIWPSCPPLLTATQTEGAASHSRRRAVLAARFTIKLRSIEGVFPPMRIAQIAPLHERVPSKLYGGTERVVSYLTDELVRRGHDVTLFASGDSKTSAKLVRCCDTALRLNPSVNDSLPYPMIMLDEVRQRLDEFDVLHFHIDFLQAPLLRDVADRTVTRQHGRLDLPDLLPFYRVFGSCL
jgi:Glycosyltransferase Family 4